MITRICDCGNEILNDWSDYCAICDSARLRANIDTAKIKEAKRNHPSYMGLYTSVVHSPNPELRRYGWEHIVTNTNNPLLQDIAQQRIDEIDASYSN